MRKVTENPANSGTLAEYFSPRSKVKDLALQHQSHPHFTSFHQDTPVKPSHIPNQLSYRPPRRFLPLQSPELCHRDKLGPPRHPPPAQGPTHPIGRDEVTESKATLSYSRSRTITAKSHKPNKVQPSEKTSIPTVELRRPPVTPSLNMKADKDGYPQNLSESERWCPGNSQWPHMGFLPSPSCQSSDRSGDSSLIMRHNPVVTWQESKQTPSNKKFIPGVDLNYTSPKRHRDFEAYDNSAKRLCVQGANSDKAQKSKPTVGDSLRPSLMPTLRHSSDLELSPKPTMGAKQSIKHPGQSHIEKLRSPLKPDEHVLKKSSEENSKKDKSNTLSPEAPHKGTNSVSHVQLGSNHSSYTHHSNLALPVKTHKKRNQVEENRKLSISTPKAAPKPKSGPSGCRTLERSKTGRTRRPVVIPDDEELFTPDPMTYVVGSSHKTAKSKIDGGTIKLSTSEKSSLSSTVTSLGTPVTPSLSHKTQNSTVPGSANAGDTQVSSSANKPKIFPTVSLLQVKSESIKNPHSKDEELKNSRTASSGRQLMEESVKSDEKHTSLLPNNVISCTSETDTATTKQSSASPSQSPAVDRQPIEGSRNQVNEEDPIDVELGLSFALDFDLSQSSHSSEEEQLLSFQEMMGCIPKSPDKLEKGAFSEPSTPGYHSSQLKSQPLPSTTSAIIYKNNLDQMLKEINTSKKAKEIETQLLTACKEDLLRIAEFEEAEENQEEGISTEQQEFLQRYSLMSSAIREVPPGELVFNLEKFGQLFNQDTLELRKCMATPQGTAQKTLLWSSPVQLRRHVHTGLFQEAYNDRSPCPAQVTRFLFKMMSVQSDRLLSEKMLQALCDIARTAAYQIVKSGSQQFKVWVPSLADVTLVLMNMGVAFVTLFPFDNLQPLFTEEDLLEDEYVKVENPSSNKEWSAFPEHNCTNILNYLSFSMDLCPRVYSDEELLLLLTIVGRICLDTQFICVIHSLKLHHLQSKIVNNIRDWDTMLSKICLALTNLTDDHHNMCLIVQLLPDNPRGKQLRRHLSLSMISKLLDGNCTYRPKEKEFQLSNLRPYLPRMQPSTLLRGLQASSSRSQKDKEDDMLTLDQQAYYLCYSLLTLANEASNFHFFSAQQKEQLLFMCTELETHVKCDIRESEKCLYRSKVKDLVARIYTKWQMLLQRTRPLHGKLYDYWQPLSVDTLFGGQEEQKGDDSDDGESNVVEEDGQEEETNGAEEDEVEMTAEEEQKEEERLEAEEDMKQDENLGEPGGDISMHDTSEKEEVIDTGRVELNQEMPEMEPQVHKESDNSQCIEVDTENIPDIRQTSDQVATCDLVS
ncbi:SMC5-SMC6 complex localization factor protein 2 isoform X2 [Mastacembelus armatus]|uniref:SMC5-SMC6 complex localization factor 2 n=1 Tax=Mastacembelus armatus TaxID=205130 RepID=A0A3Q3KIH9_9TELE|nr:SMC5-SMC6 complex localization factor protein 2-like isoform X2 [Mastacembelus armatus]